MLSLKKVTNLESFLIGQRKPTWNFENCIFIFVFRKKHITSKIQDLKKKKKSNSHYQNTRQITWSKFEALPFLTGVVWSSSRDPSMEFPIDKSLNSPILWRQSFAARCCRASLRLFRLRLVPDPIKKMRAQWEQCNFLRDIVNCSGAAQSVV